MKKRNLNLDAAALHILGDLLNSVGVIFASIIIYVWPDMWYIDPLCTYLFAIIVLWTTRLTFWECVQLILERVPDHIQTRLVRESLLRIEGVQDIHDVHIWALSNDKASFTCHLVLQPSADGQQQRVLEEADMLLR